MIKKAFSMIEMSLVLIIIGVIAAGLVKGSSLIKSSQLASARSLTVKSTVTTIEGLVAWYETSLQDSIKPAESYNGAQISTWYDISPSSIVLQKNALSKTASATVTYKSSGINGFASLYFNGSGNITLSAFYQGLVARSTIFIVFQPQTTLTATISDSYSSGSTASIGFTSTTVALNAGSSVATSTTTNSASFSNSQNYILSVYLNGASSKAYSNNSKVTAGNGTISPGTNLLGGLTIGSNKSATSNFKGLISEVIIFNRPLLEQERKDVFRYLADKYKIKVTGF